MKPKPRFPEFVGALNFRDMGGYLAADGRRTRWHTLYRSGTTHSLTVADLAQVAALGIRHSYDLRSNTERRVHPSALRGIHDIDYRVIDHDDIAGDISRMLKQTGAQPEHSTSMMMTLYRRIAFDFRVAFRALFIQLERSDLPLVFNCTAGPQGLDLCQPEQIRRTLLDLNAPQRGVAAILVDCLVEPIQEALYHLGAIDLVQDLVAALGVARQRRV